MRLPKDLEWTAACGQTTPPLGWFSPCFGAKVPIATLVGKGVIEDGRRLTTDISIEFRQCSETSMKAERPAAVPAHS